MTPFPSSSPRRGDDEATPRVLAAAFALESIAERLKMRCVPSFLRVSPSLPPSHSCAPFSRTLSLPPPRSSRVPSRSPPPRARTTRTAPPTPSHPRRNPNPSRTFHPPPRRRPSTRPRRGSSETPAGRFRDAPSTKPSPRPPSQAPAPNRLWWRSARPRSEQNSLPHAPPRARPRACPRLRPRAKRRRRLGHPRASLGSRRTREPLPSALARWGPRTACRTTRSTRFARRTSRRGNA